jgi:CheY-like chemotaxis protein
MSLKSLVLCSDEKIVRVLRRVLNDLEIEIEHCTEPDGALRKLTRQRFEAVIIDCTDVKTATAVLKGARSAPVNKRAIAVAIMDGHNGLRSAFAMGAHFVLYKPVSSERAKSSFRAARALMKRERRRNARVPVQMQVTLNNRVSGFTQKVASTDLSEGGMAIQMSKRQQDAGPWEVHFTLPGAERSFELTGEVAWHNPGGQVGIRFTSLAVDMAHELRQWLNHNAPDGEKDDPPVRCKLTDLSLGGCYLEIPSPFPVGTRIVLAMRVANIELRVEGAVRVMHPDIGMGVEFTQRTSEQRNHVEKFIQALMNAGEMLPELMVEPEGLESETMLLSKRSGPSASEGEDPLLDLFLQKASLPPELFLNELRKQRRSHHPDSAEETILPV